MNANAFRYLYAYHFIENRNVWGYVSALSWEQFTRPIAYSAGSLRNQVIHLMTVEDAWFSGLRGAAGPDDILSTEIDDRQALRAYGDKVEQSMRDYLAGLRDEMLFEKPFAEGEDKDLILWQVLLHVVNHGTDHRAQILRDLSDLGVKTAPQDYIFYVYDHP
jgi:uncharacterized damage-inducible protein DinB